MVTYLALIVAFSSPSKAVPDALSAPMALAKASNRAVFAVFTATWCKPCGELRTVLNSPTLSKLLGQKLVVTYIDVSDSTKAENLLLRAKYCSGAAPMPAYAIIASNGRLVANGFGNSPNKSHRSVLSYPLTRLSIGDFMRMLSKIPKGLDVKTLWQIRAELEKRIT
jgi:thiol-disulfide isomerase/thioredoxin